MKEKSNKQFMILSAIGIIQVVMCHLAPDVKLTGYNISIYFVFYAYVCVYIRIFLFGKKGRTYI